MKILVLLIAICATTVAMDSLTISPEEKGKVYQGQDFGDLRVLTPDVIKLVTSYIVQGGNIKDTINLQLTSKSYKEISLTLPFAFDLSNLGEKVNDRILESIVIKFPNTDVLNVSGCPITNTGISYLKNLHNLRILNISLCENITDQGFSYLKTNTKLFSLDLGGCNITNKGLNELENLPQLSILHLYKCPKISGLGFSVPTQVTSLDISGCNISAENLLGLGRRDSLSSLYAANCNIDDISGLAAILPNLSLINLSGCPIGSASFTDFQKFQALTFLNFSYCKNINEQEISSLRNILRGNVYVISPNLSGDL